MSGGSFESSQRSEPVCATRFSSIKNCFKTQASGLARGRGWSRIGQCELLSHVAYSTSRALSSRTRLCFASHSSDIKNIYHDFPMNREFTLLQQHTTRTNSIRGGAALSPPQSSDVSDLTHSRLLAVIRRRVLC